MSIWEYANPKKFMETSSWVLPWVTALALVALIGGLIWGFFFTPDDYKQGATVKIIYLHVPAAMMAINAWVMMLVMAITDFTGPNNPDNVARLYTPRSGRLPPPFS